MGAKLNTELFIAKAASKHGGKYDYNQANYTGSKNKINIICSDHGLFEQTPNAHLNGQGCPVCARQQIIKKTRLDNNEFIKKANKVHNHKYDYSKTKYVNSITKIIITCPDHGDFKQTASGHLSAGGCPKCGGSLKLNNDEFINRARKIHNNKYDYSLVNYISLRKHIKIICSSHGTFFQKPSHHLRGRGCPDCAKNAVQRSSEQRRLGVAEFVKRSREIHGLKYDYEFVKYISNNKKVEIICNDHGVFKQRPCDHLDNHGCPMCAQNQKLTTSEFIKRSIIKHGNTYDYSKSTYVTGRDKITIICHEHGAFNQTASDHLSGRGCNKCMILESDPIKDIKHLLTSYDISFRENDRSLIKPYEIDLYLPNYKFGIEFHGLFWHSYSRKESSQEKMKHWFKASKSIDIGINLIQILENEWANKCKIVKSIIKHKIGISKKIYARKCIVKELSNKDYYKFLNNNHLQGKIGSRYKFGLIYENEIVAVMGFSKHYKYDFELIRYACKINTTIIGGASKLLHYFQTNNKGSILSYCDRRYSIGSLYKQLGFKLAYITRPNYFYVKSKNIYSRQQFQKHKLNTKLKEFNPDITESENMFNNGYRRLWDAGHFVFIK